MKKIIFSLFLLLFSAFFVFAGGKVEKIKPKNPESWKETFDINDKKGKHNFLITATDIAGNEKLYGPYNMYVDPKSDLPQVAISNPVNGSRVTGNLNIVGTCVDDDAVSYVEFSIDGSDPVRAKGAEFWSFFLNTTEMTDGIHTIEAYGVDINGLKGNPTKTFFHLDKDAPQTSLTQKSELKYASGKINFAGTIEDGNGVERLLYSVDNGEKFEEVPVKINKKTGTATFNLSLDTKKIEDGPQVLWFKAIDKQGSVGIYTYLVYVDNTPPEISFLYPDEKMPVSGAFSVAGRAYDTVGLEKLSYKCGKIEGDFELIPGNPYFVQEFDLTAEKAKGATVEIIATDLAGNVVKASRKVVIDSSLDAPQVEITSPQPMDAVEGAVFLSGVVFDKYAPAEIRYKLDNNAEVSVPCDPSGFGVVIDGLTSGEHTIKVTPINVKGVAGKEQTVKFKAVGAEPIVAFANGKTVLTVTNAQNGTAEIIVNANAGLKTVFYDIDQTGPVDAKVRAGSTNTTIKLPYKKGEAPVTKKVDVTVIDMLDRQVTQNLVLSVTDMLGVGGGDEVLWADNKTDSQNRVLVTDKLPLSAVYTSTAGGAVQKVTVSPSGAFETGVEGNTISLKPLQDGNMDISLTVTDTLGASVTSKTLSVFCDLSAPVIKLSDEKMTSFVRNSLVIQGTVTDGAGVKSVSYTVDGENYTALPTSFNQTINLASVPDGAFVLKVVAEDNIGRKTYAYRNYYKNSNGAEVRMVLPAEGDVVNGTVTAAFVSESLFPLSKVEYKANPSDTKWTEIPVSTMPNALIGSAAAPINDQMMFRFTDVSGVEKIYQTYKFDIDNSSDKPTVEIHLPQENAIITEDFTLSGIVYDDDGVKRLYYAVDDQPFKALEVDSSYSVDLPLSIFNDNEHTISVYAEDIYGVKSDTVVRKLRVSLENPVATIDAPTIDKTVKGVVAITGTAADKNAIGKVEVSVDNGNTYNLAEGAEKWSYTLNTSVLNDGPHVVFVKVTDKYEQSSIFSSIINTDNTPPIMKFTYPLSDASFENELFISGHAYDNVNLQSVTATIRPLGGGTASLQNISLTSGEPLVTKMLDVSKLPEGFYNLEIVALDKGENITRVAKNFSIKRSKDANRIDLMYPLNGETISGEFNVYGQVFAEKRVEQASLYVDGQLIDTADVSNTNFVSFRLDNEKIVDGTHKLSIRATFAGGRAVESNIHSVIYKATGPWVSVDNLGMGDFAIDRPWLRGSAGYVLSPEEMEALKSKDATKEEKRQIKLKKVKNIEVSFDNGKTFTKAKGKPHDWKFRLQTQDLAEGSHFLLVKATMENNEVAVSRTIVKVDKTLPEVTLISPGEGGRYNQQLEYLGIVSDDIELNDVELHLRKGDKAFYGVPMFVQGLHFEAGFWGASLWNMGLGLSFFDNKVRVQFHYGQFTQKQYEAIAKTNAKMRYGGNIFSFKLLATVFDLPVGRYGGPDWDWLHFTAALGANFSVFTQTQSGKPQLLSALLMQVSLPRVELPKKKVKYFGSFEFFVEGSLWFIPTDVDSVSSGKSSNIKSVIPHLSAGFRVDVF
ncbi:MAG: Ig-like domain-containing protein [Treponemataceae bacterium]